MKIEYLLLSLCASNLVLAALLYTRRNEPKKVAIVAVVIMVLALINTSTALNALKLV